MNQEYLNKLIKEKNIIFIEYTSFAKLEGKGHKKYLLLERFPVEIKEDKIVYKTVLTCSPCLKEGDILLTEEEFNKLTEMKYAVLQNSTQEICNWFKNLTPHNNNTKTATLDGSFKFLIYNPNSNSTDLGNIIDENTILLSPEDFTKKFIKKENMRNITYQQAQSIIDIACDNWKEKLFNKWGATIVYKNNIDIDEDFYKEMRKACTKEQHELFDEIFGNDIVIPEKNTLVYIFNGFEWLMRYYSHYNFEDNKHCCFRDQFKGETGAIKWEKVSLTNPLIEKPQYI